MALNADTGKLAWYFLHAPGETFDLDEVFERVLVDDGGQKLVFSARKAGILWKNDRATGKYLGHKETVFQNIYDSFDPETGEPHYRNDIVENQIGTWVQSCPTSHCAKLSGNARAKDRAEGRRRQRWRRQPEVLRVARIERQRRQAGGL